ncbi:MAG: hypothetical protein CO093_05115 [Alphaproteobacteria bacterium CG_4_9_14_3_um_filter_47_13]|nr:MAG: hypothetical protein CO093_05115 [Alphaproteobacteria bacterium CG_4_9_14_3_um_filter_47_13]
MGSLTSRPEIPQVQQPVIYTIPAAPIPAAPMATTSTTPIADHIDQNNTIPESAGNEEAQRLAREDNLLRRSRGRLGTVLTGFSGLLSQTVTSQNRKTLLGE